MPTGVYPRKFSVEERFWAKVNKLGPILRPELGHCWTWVGGKNENEYGVFWDGKSLGKAHRFSWFMVTNKRPGRMMVLHKCDNPPCVRPDHLFLGDNSSNMKDCFAKGRLIIPLKIGEACHLSKLTETEILEIRKLGIIGTNKQKIADQFNISKRHVYDILSKKVWARL